MKRALLIGILVVGLLAAAFPAQGGAVGTDDPLEGYPEGSYVMEGGAIAVPLKKASPDWLTDEVRAKVSEAAKLGLGYDVESGEFVHPMALQYLFIRPGAWMLAPYWCTMNFIFGNPGSYEIGSAGHCLDGSEVIILAAPSLVFAIGKGRGPDGGVGNDYGTVKIYSQFQSYVDADTAVIGGPGPFADCATYDDPIGPTSPVPIKHFGHGLAIGTGGTPRSGVAVSYQTDATLIKGGFDHRNAVFWNSPSAPGDSGSPVLTAASGLCGLGEGLAILTHLVIIGPDATLVAGTHVSKAGTPVVGNGLPV